MIRPYHPPAVSRVAALGGLKLAISVDWVEESIYIYVPWERGFASFVHEGKERERESVLFLKKKLVNRGRSKKRSSLYYLYYPLHTLARMFPIKLFSLFRANDIFPDYQRYDFGPRLVSYRRSYIRGKGPITCQYRHYWRTERNINVYDPMCVHPNPRVHCHTPIHQCFSTSGSQISTRSTLFLYSSPTDDIPSPPPPPKKREKRNLPSIRPSLII